MVLRRCFFLSDKRRHTRCAFVTGVQTCALPICDIFRIGKSASQFAGEPLRLHKHQVDAIRQAAAGQNYVLTTGTGSGKSLSYIVPIVDHVLRRGTGKGIQAIVVYPMNALANSQEKELEDRTSTRLNSSH